MRSLEKQVEKVVRKIAFETVSRTEVEVEAEKAGGGSDAVAVEGVPVDGAASRPSSSSTSAVPSSSSVSPVSPERVDSVSEVVQSAKTTSTENLSTGEFVSTVATPVLPKVVSTLKVTVTPEDLEKYVGPPKYPQDTMYDDANGALPVGIVMGLAWNPLGGSPIFIETAAIPTALSEAGGGVNVVTGQPSWGLS